jgi:hypothetical protein
MHWNDACQSAVTATFKAITTVAFRTLRTTETSKREQHLRALADKLLFTVEKRGNGFTLSRTADVGRPVRREGLSLDQAEDLLATWKLRGLGGG